MSDYQEKQHVACCVDSQFWGKYTSWAVTYSINF